MVGGDLLDQADPEALGMSAVRLELLDHTLRQCVESGQLPFARLKVMRHGQLIHDVTVNSRLGTQTEDSIYRYYSMTKIVASVATLLAVERGLMRLDDPVEKYIPEAANARVVVQGSAAGGTMETEPAASMHTVRQCLTHTAGLGYGGLSTAGFGMMNDEVDEAYLAAGCGADMLAGGMTRFESLAELAAVLAAQPLRHHPGQKFDYAMGHVSCTASAQLHVVYKGLGSHSHWTPKHPLRAWELQPQLSLPGHVWVADPGR